MLCATYKEEQVLCDNCGMYILTDGKLIIAYFMYTCGSSMADLNLSGTSSTLSILIV